MAPSESQDVTASKIDDGPVSKDNEFVPVDFPLGHLETFAEFNQSFNNTDNNAIDPVLLSGQSTPNSLFDGPSSVRASPEPPHFNIDGTQDWTNPFYDPLLYNDPFLHQSIEHTSGHNAMLEREMHLQQLAVGNRHLYAPSPLRNQLVRRSVSEPPGALPDSLDMCIPQQYLPITHHGPLVFHRGGMSLGKPQIPGIARAEGRGRSSTRAQSRSRPYSTNKRRPATPTSRQRGQSTKMAPITSQPVNMVDPIISNDRQMLSPYAVDKVNQTNSSYDRSDCGAVDPRLMISIPLGQLEDLIMEAVKKAIKELPKDNLETSAAL